MRSTRLCSALVLIFFALAPTAWSLDDGDGTANNCDHYNAYGNPYFGDTHVHTTFSVDAFTQGVETTPEQAYEFAKGALLGIHPFDEQGQPTRTTQIDRPLDFAMVSDHAEFFGEYSLCTDPGSAYFNDPTCDLLRQRNQLSFISWNVLLGAQQNNVDRFDFCGIDGTNCTQESGTIWQRMKDAAAQHYDRSSDCSFTTFVGYEWTGAPTSVNEDGDLETLNLHRNVIFRNSIAPAEPNTYLDSGFPERLWNSLQSECLDVVDGTNECDVLTIPHNSNLSQGLMFEQIKPNGDAYGLGHALKRNRFEPLVEVIQHKGQSECLPNGSDELCDYEIVPWGHLAGNFIGGTEPRPEGFVRNVLLEGLAMKDSIGANAFRYGMIGSTDTHLGTPGLVAETADYPGHGGAGDPNAGGGISAGLTDTPEFNPGGLAVVWAPQNSRAALFDSMRRREVYATSGPRHVVRFYGGWDLPLDICSLPNRVEVAYNNAVPMGSNMTAPGAGQTAPQFLVSALKDAGTVANPGHDLQRVQIIKGWTDNTGAKHEQVFDVAGDPNNGAGVDLGSCATTGAGFAELCQRWEDPQFDPTQNAFYYARVVENPSCRWTQQQCLVASPAINCANPGSVPAEYLACCDADIPKTVQERSWTSPIWYDKNVSLPNGC